MALKKDSNFHRSEQGKSQNENSSQIEFKNLEIKKETKSQPLEGQKEMIMRMDFSILVLINRS